MRIRIVVQIFIACLCASFTSAQRNYNIELLSNVSIGHEGNDIWGYVDEQGTEYAVMGGDTATYIFDLTDPTQPEIVASIVGDLSIWRDFKSYGHYIYGIAYRGNDGMLVIDMSGAPETITYEYYAPQVVHMVDGEIVLDAPFTVAHNIFIDEDGYIYFSDCPGFHRGVAVFKIGDNPLQPEFVSIFNSNVSHDIYVKDGKAFSSDIFADGFSVWDVSDQVNPVQIGFHKTTREFTHNSWLSDDGNYLFTTDEQGAAFIESYDVRDPSNIKFLDKIQVIDAGIRNVIPHNTHYYDGFLITSYYVDGVVVFDASRPDNLVEVGRYDTYFGELSGYHGCWGAYPYLPSGNIIASDIESGLFVLKPQYTRAAFLEGVVTDAITGDPIQNVQITFLEESPEELRTAFNGEFKTGKAFGGNYKLDIYHPRYLPQTIDVELVNGEVNMQSIVLTPLESLSITGIVTDADNGSPIPNAQIVFTDKELVLTGTTDDNGQYHIDGYPGTFEVILGAWGFQTLARNEEAISADIQFDLELNAGYSDEFALDLGWEVFNESVSAGPWVRDVPYPTYNGNRLSNPDMDIDGDIGFSCYMTGNQFGNGTVGSNDLDDGTTILRSPNILLDESIDNPILTNYVWFYASERTDREQLRNDTLYIQILQNGQFTNIDTITEDTEGWELREYTIGTYIDTEQSFKIQYRVSDFPGPQQGNLVEAAIDGFAITNKFSVSVDPVKELVHFDIYPNPFTHQITVDMKDTFDPFEEVHFILVNHLGQEVLRTMVSHGKVINTDFIQPGIYFGLISQQGITSQAVKLIKSQ